MALARLEETRPSAAFTAVLIGKESVGKSQLIRSLTGRGGASANFRGTTVACEFYRHNQCTFVDTPGILRESDNLTTQLALRQLEDAECVLVVAKATHLDEDLDYLLPLVRGRRGAVVVSFWDRVKGRREASETLAELEREAGLPLIPVDGRKLGLPERRKIRAALAAGGTFPPGPLKGRAGWKIEPRRGLFEFPILGPLLALALLFGPALVAVMSANGIANYLYDEVGGGFEVALSVVRDWPSPFGSFLGGEYGLLAMGPFLILYAVPTVLLFALMQGIYKTSGLVDRITVAIHPLVRPLGLAGRDLVRVIMGFGCNVPAVINSRSCSSCSRGNCVSAISFGSACSYQLPATVAVFSAAGMPELTPVYLIVLAATTALYLRVTVPKISRLASNRLAIVGRDFLQWPSAKGVAAEVRGVATQFFKTALPVFFVICLVAEAMRSLGVIGWLSRSGAPAMALFRLPGEAAVAVILGSVRKDGIAIGLLDGSWHSLKVDMASPVQVLTIVYLAGVLLPCIVTLLTVSREMSPGFALRMAGRQAAAASIFSLMIAWFGALLF